MGVHIVVPDAWIGDKVKVIHVVSKETLIANRLKAQNDELMDRIYYQETRILVNNHRLKFGHFTKCCLYSSAISCLFLV